MRGLVVFVYFCAVAGFSAWLVYQHRARLLPSKPKKAIKAECTHERDVRFSPGYQTQDGKWLYGDAYQCLDCGRMREHIPD